MTTFVVLAAVGGALCLLSFFVDGLFEALDVDIAGGFLSLTSLSGVLRREEPETSTTIVGAHGHVTTRVPAGGYGEVHLVLAGTTVKRTATAAEPLDRGTLVEVLHELSATAVRVQPLADADAAPTTREEPL